MLMKIKTKRLLLRPLKKTDVESIVENINNLNVSQWLLVVPYPYNKNSAMVWIKNNKKKWLEKKKESYVFGIELLEEKKIIGGMGIHHVDLYQRKATMGYWLGEKYWNKGYGSEALKSVVNFAFKKLKLNRLEASVFVGNPSSWRILEKLGFKKEGLKRKSARCKADGRIKDEIIYGLLKNGN